MDAVNIFMKITRNAKFNKIKYEVTPKLKAPKLEPIENSIKVEKQIKPHNNSDYFNNEIKLLGDISSENTVTNKAKRRKFNNIPTRDVGDTNKLKALEELRQFRNKLNIKVVGSRIPSPITSFSQLAITTEMISNLQECGYGDPTPIQMQAIPLMLEGRHLLACAPTGSGKTIAFLVPILHSLQAPQKPCQTGCRALILCPTRELAKQIHAECMRLVESSHLRIKVIGKTNKLFMPRKQCNSDIIISTPQRICHLLAHDNNALSMANVRWIVIDEADKLFEEYGDGARSFRSQLAHILDACTHVDRRIAMFSATYTPLVAGWCRRESRKGYGGGMVRVMIGERNTAPDLVDQHLLYVGSESGKLLAFRELMRGGLSGLTLKPPVLVFVQSKDRAQHLFNELIYDGISVDAIHADRTQHQRDNTVRAFREGKVWVLICTELLARGLDFKGVNLVVNYDLPQSAIAYVHRVGRAGRAGRSGSALTLYTDEDRATKGLLRPIAAAIRRSGCYVDEHLLHGSKAAVRKNKRQIRSSQVKRDQISTKLQPKRNTLRKGKRSRISSNNSDNEITASNVKKTKVAQ